MSKKDFGSRLREARVALNKTQQEMGRLLGLGKSGFGKYERMENFPNFKILQALAKEYNVSMDYLIGNRGTVFYGENENRKDNVEMAEFLYLMEKVPLVHHSVMSYFQKFKIENQEVIEKELAKTKEKES
jgi:transcriptional regulator with XRE-family HTH domain